MRPIGKYIVLDQVKEEATTDCGLLLSGEDTDKLRYGRGVVVASGTDVEVISSGEELYYDKRATLIVRTLSLPTRFSLGG